MARRIMESSLLPQIAGRVFFQSTTLALSL
jgi:hypothetical protein